MSEPVRIAFLADHVDVIPQLARWFEKDWAPFYAPGGPGNAEDDLRETANRDQLPIGLVAMKGDIVCGTAALKMESVSTTPEFSPWLAALLVGPEFRGQGISRQLITAVIELATTLGFPEIFCGTDPRFADVVLPGWIFVKKVEYFVSDAEIYMKRLV